MATRSKSLDSLSRPCWRKTLDSRPGLVGAKFFLGLLGYVVLTRTHVCIYSCRVTAFIFDKTNTVCVWYIVMYHSVIVSWCHSQDVSCHQRKDHTARVLLFEASLVHQFNAGTSRYPSCFWQLIANICQGLQGGSLCHSSVLRRRYQPCHLAGLFVEYVNSWNEAQFSFITNMRKA